MFPSRRGVLAPAALLATLLAGCGDNAPSRIVGPSARLDAVSADGRYLVGLKSNLRADFADRVKSLGGIVELQHAGGGLAVVSGLSAAAAARLRGFPDVSDVQADVTVTVAPAASTIQQVAAVGVESQGAPSTAALFFFQWDMLAIHADVAWANGKLGSSSVTVAIIDTGLDYDNPDLTGLVDLSRSVSFVKSDDDYLKAHFPTRNLIDDLNGHGTNVGSTVSSKASVFAGVTSRTTLMGVKVIGASGVGSLGTILSGVLYSADHGADVANLSLGGAFSKSGNGRVVGLVNQVFNYASRKGMLVVAAAGNEAADLQHNGSLFATFCDAPNVVCVSATGPTSSASVIGPWTNVDAIADYSNVGQGVVTVAAPGGTLAGFIWSFCARHLLVTTPSGDVFPCATGDFIFAAAGTSQASPHVAGLAALLVSELGHGNPSQVASVLRSSADDLGKVGRDALYGFGRINVARAVGF